MRLFPKHEVEETKQNIISTFERIVVWNIMVLPLFDNYICSEESFKQFGHRCTCAIAVHMFSGQVKRADGQQNQHSLRKHTHTHTLTETVVV